ncbi:MAG: alpha/beta hydrolase [Melioribacteraceae bacterium]|nr:MAG: alpha/beta hydrolase [Melioribacteraceae bacterium]
MKKINGISVYTYGNENNQAVIFVHGFPFDNSMWKDQVNALKENYFVITYDIRGFNKSDVGDGQYTMEMFADDLQMLIENMNLNNPVICGLSMGGYIALRHAEKYGGIKALILADTKSQSDPDAAKINRANGIRRINEEGVGPFVSDFIPNTLSAKNKLDNHIVDRLVIEAKSLSPKTLKGALLAMAARTDTSAYLEKIDFPVMFVCGKEDNLTPPSLMKELADKVKNSIFEIIDDAGHLPPGESPEKFNSLLHNFLGGLE